MQDAVCDGCLARADWTNHHDGVVGTDELHDEVVVAYGVDGRHDDLVEGRPATPTSDTQSKFENSYLCKITTQVQRRLK